MHAGAASPSTTIGSKNAVVFGAKGTALVGAKQATLLGAKPAAVFTAPDIERISPLHGV